MASSERSAQETSQPRSSQSDAGELSLPVPQSDRFRVEAKSQRSPDSSIWKAEDVRTSQVVAVKRIRTELAESRELISRIKRDVKALSRLQHAGIVACTELVKDESGFFLVQEWIDGQSLADVLQNSGPINEAQATQIIATVADALDAAHERKVTHRNIKPSNILLTADGSPKLTGFGLARVDVESVLEHAGTTESFPPELLTNPRDVSAQSDIWSLGATLYQLLTGWSVREFEASLLPDAARRILFCALADEPADRFSTANEFAAALRGDNSELATRALKSPQRLSPANVRTESPVEKPASKSKKKSAGISFGKPARPAAPELAGNREPATAESSEQSAAGRSRKKKRPASRKTSVSQVDAADREDGAASGRVTKPRGPLKDEPQIKDEPQTEASLASDAVTEAASETLSDTSTAPETTPAKKSFKVSFGRSASESVESESGATSGRVTKPRRPLTEDEASEKSPSPPAGEASPETPTKNKKAFSVSFGRPSAGVDDAEPAEAASPSRSGRAKRKSPSETTPNTPSTADSVEPEAGAAAGRVTRQRRPLTDEELAAANQESQRAKDDGSPGTNEESEPASEPIEAARPRRRPKSEPTPERRKRPRASSAPEPEVDTQSDDAPESRPRSKRPRPQSNKRVPSTAGDSEAAEESVEPVDTSKSNPDDSRTAKRHAARSAKGESASESPSSRQPVSSRGAASETEPTSGLENEPDDRKRPAKSLSPTLVLGWGAALVFVLAIVFFLDSGRRQSDQNITPGSLNPGQRTTATTDIPTGQGDDFAGDEIRIGPLGQFKSIGPCLEYLQRNLSRYSGDSGGQNVRLLVSGGETYGPLVIDNTYGDYPHGIHIVAEGAARPVLAAPGETPVRLRNVRSFRLEGFDIDASECEVAVHLSGEVSGSRLVDINVTGFASRGLHLEGASGEVADEVVVESVRLETTAGDSVGVLVESLEDATSARIEISKCQFLGPFQSAIELQGGSEFVELRENIIDQVDVGILFSGDAVNWIDTLIANTTIREFKRAGVAFSHMPPTGGIRGTQMAFYRNLFVNGHGPELLFEEGFDVSQFDSIISTVGGNGIRENWSDRKEPLDSAVGEAEIVDPDQGEPTRRVEQIEFHSTERDDAGFLMLRRNSPLSTVGTPRVGTRPWIGARPAFE